MLTKKLIAKMINKLEGDNLEANSAGMASLYTERPNSSATFEERQDWLGPNQLEPDYSAQAAKELVTLCRAITKIGACSDFKTVIQILYQEIRHIIRADNFVLGISTKPTNSLIFPLIVDQGQREEPFSAKRSPSQTLIEHVLMTQTPLLVSDLTKATTPEQIAPLRPTQPIRTWLGVPLCQPAFPQTEAQGILIVWSDHSKAFTDHQAWLLSTLGSAVAMAMSKIKQIQVSQRQIRTLKIVNTVGPKLASALQLDEVLEGFLAQIEQGLKVEAGALLLTNPVTDELIFQMALGEAEAIRQIKPFRLPREEAITSHVAQTGKPLLLAKVGPMQRRFIKLALHLQVEARNFLCVPLILAKQVIGVLAVLNKHKETFNHHDLTLLQTFAPYIAIAIENIRLHESLLAERERVMAIEERVRKELARDLHDGPTQLVSSLMMSLDICQQILQQDPTLLPAELTRMQELCQRTIHQMRTLLVQLRPLELEQHGQGLAAALQVFIERRQQETKKTKLRLKVETGHLNNQVSRQEGQIESTILAIVQETVNNALKHARAKHILVRLIETASDLYTLIADDGEGFEPAQIMSHYAQQGSLGLLNIQERAQTIGGELVINSVIGQGTRISLKVSKAKTDRQQRRGGTRKLTLPPGMLQ